MRELSPLPAARKNCLKGEGGRSVPSILTVRNPKVAFPRLFPKKKRSPIKKYKMGKKQAHTTMAMSIS